MQTDLYLRFAVTFLQIEHDVLDEEVRWRAGHAMRCALSAGVDKDQAKLLASLRQRLSRYLRMRKTSSAEALPLTMRPPRISSQEERQLAALVEEIIYRVELGDAGELSGLLAKYADLTGESIAAAHLRQLVGSASSTEYARLALEGGRLPYLDDMTFDDASRGVAALHVVAWTM
ncbi:MAG: hypothetical protein ACRCYU_00275 [Nocardioides sp.]